MPETGTQVLPWFSVGVGAIGLVMTFGGVLVAAIRWMLGLHWKTQLDIEQTKVAAAESKAKVLEHAQSFQEAMALTRSSLVELWRALEENRKETARLNALHEHLQGEHDARVHGGQGCGKIPK